MASLLRLLACFALFFACQARAEPLVLPAGLELEFPPKLDLTYQVVPAYDEVAKVIAGWQGGKLQYFVTAENLTPEYRDARAYLGGLARDLQATWGQLQAGPQRTYRTAAGLDVATMRFTRPAAGPDKPAITLFAHHLTDGRNTYLAMCTPVPPAVPDTVQQACITLLKTARPARSAPPKAERSEDELVGSWVTEDTLPDGRRVVSRMELRPDLNFMATVQAGDQRLLDAAGVWSRQGAKLLWTYVRSRPALPASAKEDEDEIVSVTRDELKLKSKLTGKLRVLRRAQPAG